MNELRLVRKFKKAVMTAYIINSYKNHMYPPLYLFCHHYAIKRCVFVFSLVSRGLITRRLVCHFLKILYRIETKQLYQWKLYLAI